ncbi:hypothetical protein PM082_018524 [Marasmius tenuissimus]|nr:hypothetical protein PM082_018524 [Marasmius tenuissimus]
MAQADLPLIVVHLNQKLKWFLKHAINDVERVKNTFFEALEDIELLESPASTSPESAKESTWTTWQAILGDSDNDDDDRGPGGMRTARAERD